MDDASTRGRLPREALGPGAVLDSGYTYSRLGAWAGKLTNPGAHMIKLRATRGRVAGAVAKTSGHPVTQTLLFVAAAWLAYALLGFDEGDDQFTHTDAWGVWKVAAGFGIALAVTLGISGLRTMARVAASDSQYPVDGWGTAMYGLGATVFVAVVTAFLYAVPSSVPTGDWQIDAMDSRMGAVLAAASIPAIPWIALVWIAHRTEQKAAPPARRRRRYVRGAGGVGRPRRPMAADRDHGGDIHALRRSGNHLDRSAADRLAGPS